MEVQTNLNQSMYNIRIDSKGLLLMVILRFNPLLFKLSQCDLGGISLARQEASLDIGLNLQGLNGFAVQEGEMAQPQTPMGLAKY